MNTRMRASAAKPLLVVALLLCYNAPQAADFPLKPFTAIYDVRKDGDRVAEIETRLYQDSDGRWHYTQNTEPVGWLARAMGLSIAEHSQFLWADGRIEALAYDYHRSGREKRVALRFDGPRGVVTETINGETRQFDAMRGALDKLGVNLALRARLLQTEADTAFTIADGGRLKIYDFNIVARETTDTVFGKIQTIKISRNRRGRTGHQTHIWASPELDYLAVRLRKQDDDGHTEGTLRAFNPR